MYEAIDTGLVEGSLSGIYDVKSGIPQAFILGPLLFMIFIASLQKHSITASFFSSADHTKLVRGRNGQDSRSLIHVEGLD
jgi:hypothetical protein